MSFSSSSPAWARGVLVAALVAGGCASGEAGSEEIAESEGAQIATGVVVADARTIAVAEVLPDRVKVPLAVAERYRTMSAGTVFVGARGDTKGKNPDGFLRRVVRVAEEDGALVVTTTPATLTDAIVRGAVRTSSGSGGERAFDSHGTSEQSIRPLTREQLQGIAIDFADKPLFDGVDEIDVPGGRARFVESIRLERAMLTSRPVVDVDLRIADGAVSRFVAKVEGNLDTSVRAHATVVAEGDVNDATLAELRARKHDVERVIFASPRVPLPTFSVGGVPVSPSVEFKVTLRCALSFGGPLAADAGIEARANVRLGGVYEGGAWRDPIRSEFEIAPSFAMSQGGEVDARCAIEADAVLFAYGTSGVKLSVAPYVDFGVKRDGDLPGTHRYRVKGGAVGALRGRADVFGVPGELDRPLADWEAPALLHGTIATP